VETGVLSIDGPARLELRSAWGVIRVEARDGCVCGCHLPTLTAEPARPFRWTGRALTAVHLADRQALERADRFIRAIFSGRTAAPPPFAWPSATPFMLRVWRALTAIPAGETVEYGAVARCIGRPGGSRAVGRACSANPLPLFIPCHRVLPRDGSLGGFSCGLPWKRLLLEREGRGKKSCRRRWSHSRGSPGTVCPTVKTTNAAGRATRFRGAVRLAKSRA